MKRIVPFLLAAVVAGCGSDQDDDLSHIPSRNFRQDMRDLVMGISTKAKSEHPGFAVIPQNGIELVSTNDSEVGPPATTYLAAIDGNGQEDLFYGYDNDDVATPTSVTSYLRNYLDLSKSAGKTILVIDYASTPSKMQDAWTQNDAAGYVGFAEPYRNLDAIPAHPPHHENTADITQLSEARNFLFFINPQFSSKADFLDAVKATNYDAVILDLFLENEALTPADLDQLRFKANGGRRMLICYMSIGEAEDYRYYWQSSWNSNRPAWLEAENPDWPGNYKVQYWNADWQSIIYKGSDSYLDKILDAGFDGVYLDIIDAFEYFEAR